MYESLSVLNESSSTVVLFKLVVGTVLKKNIFLLTSKCLPLTRSSPA